MNALQRWSLVGALSALLLGGLLLDRVPGTLPPQLEPVDTAVVRSAIGDPAPLTASWYCAVGSSAPGGYGNHVINVSNVSAHSSTANVSVITNTGPGPT
ncbi:MAG: hypothetical protein KJN63_10070, partial [Acidimicrobiia bacterium]|nr:hypothetical protein [Acidimicrobiia bacterium]